MDKSQQDRSRPQDSPAVAGSSARKAAQLRPSSENRTTGRASCTRTTRRTKWCEKKIENRSQKARNYSLEFYGKSAGRVKNSQALAHLPDTIYSQNELQSSRRTARSTERSTALLVELRGRQRSGPVSRVSSRRRAAGRGKPRRREKRRCAVSAAAAQLASRDPRRQSCDRRGGCRFLCKPELGILLLQAMTSFMNVTRDSDSRGGLLN